MSRACPQCEKSFADDAFFCGFDGTITIEQLREDEAFDRRLGKRLGDYIVVARVADGAMGRVYEGRHPETRARVAIKVLHDAVLSDPIAVERFRREYETANEFDHPYIVDVLEFGTTEDGSFFLTMEYLEGQELSGVLREAAPLKPASVARLMSQLALGLQHAHSFGVIHRDLKPDNVFVCDNEHGGAVRILDFGSVKLQMETGPKLTAMGTTLGSPYYMSPEQALGKLDLDHRADVFAQGAIMYELATGMVAFEGANVAEILMRIVQHDPPPVSDTNDAFGKAYDEVVAKAIHKDKAERYASNVELAEAMLRALGLPADVERWANASLAQIESELATPSAVTAGDTSGRATEESAPFAGAHSDSIMGEFASRTGFRARMWIVAVVAFSAVVAGAYFLF